jgi:hypothetical protein
MGYRKSDLITTRYGHGPGKKLHRPQVDDFGQHRQSAVQSPGSHHSGHRGPIGEHELNDMTGKAALATAPKPKHMGAVTPVHGAMVHTDAYSKDLVQSMSATSAAALKAAPLTEQPFDIVPSMGKRVPRPEPVIGQRHRDGVPFKELQSLGDAIMAKAYRAAPSDHPVKMLQRVLPSTVKEQR